MGVSFIGRDELRGRGRPAAPVVPAIRALLQRTRDNRNAARIEIEENDSAEDVAQMLAQLRAAARDLGGTLRVQPRTAAAIFAQRQVRFYLEGGT